VTAAIESREPQCQTKHEPHITEPRAIATGPNQQVMKLRRLQPRWLIRTTTISLIATARGSVIELRICGWPWPVAITRGRACGMLATFPLSATTGKCLLARLSVCRRALLSLLCALVATDGDLFSANLHFDPAIVDSPIADGTLLRIHGLSPSNVVFD
jgi:hypothetical protein